ncbi:MAG: response regulator [Myxococcales bacterium]|nr:response regulator [Myxococcales bacterium]
MSKPSSSEPGLEAAERTRGLVGRVLLAEDNDELRWLLARALRRDGHQVIEVSDGCELLDQLAREVRDDGKLEFADVIVSDIRMPGYTGIAVLHGLRQSGCTVPVVLITAFGDPETHESVSRMSSALLLDKPLDVEELRRAVQAALEHKSCAA